VQAILGHSANVRARFAVHDAAMTLSPYTRLVLVADRRTPAQTTVRRFRVARLDLRSAQGEQRFEHLKRVYD
jgi:hypothetical protein